MPPGLADVSIRPGYFGQRHLAERHQRAHPVSAAGIDWINAWDNQTFSGGRLATLQAPLHKIPIFIRKGADVKLPDLEELWKESLEIAAQKSDLDQLQKKEFGTQ